MKEMIFIDSTFFIALNSIENINHERALNWVKSMLSETIGLVTSMIVIAETSSVLKESGIEKAKRFLRLLEYPGIQILEDNPIIQEEALRIFQTTEKANLITFFDVWKVALMHYYGITKILTFKESFDKLQVVRIPRK